MPDYFWNDDEIAILRARYPFDRKRDIANDLGRTPGAVQRKASLLGLRKANLSERPVTHYSVDERAFDRLTGDTAYVLGFILADGSITKSRLKITNNDLNIMQDIRVVLGSNHPLMVPRAARDKTFTLMIVNKRLTNGLRRHGITENKSLTATWPTVADDLLGPMLRGYFDGDGHVAYSRRGGLRMKFTSGSRDLLAGLSAAIANYFDEDTRPIATDKGRSNAHRLWYYGGHAARIAHLMYADDGLHIARKRAVFAAYAERDGARRNFTRGSRRPRPARP